GAADACVRLAGDEFAVILPDTSGQEAANTRERLVEQVRSSCRTAHGEPLMISCGIAELGDGDAVSLTSAADADLLMQKTGRSPEKKKKKKKNLTDAIGGRSTSGTARGSKPSPEWTRKSPGWACSSRPSRSR